MKEDHRSYKRNFCSCEKKAWKKIQACNLFLIFFRECLNVFFYVQHRSLSSERHKIHMNLALSLLLAQALFLAGIRKTSNKVGQW